MGKHYNDLTIDFKNSVYDYFLKNKNISYDEIKKEFGIYSSQVSKIISEFLIKKRKNKIEFFNIKKNDVTENELITPLYTTATYEELIKEIPVKRKLDYFELIISKKRQIINNSLRKIELENLLNQMKNEKSNDIV